MDFTLIQPSTEKVPGNQTNVNPSPTQLFAATKVLVLPENAIMKNAVMFLQYFIMQSRLYARAMNAILARGEALLHTTLMAIGVYAQRNHVEVLSDVLLSLNKKYPAEFAQWIRMLEVENFPTPSVTFQEKQQFMRSILRLVSRLISSDCLSFQL